MGSEIDVVLDYNIMPPLVTPVTNRAKQFLDIPAPATGLILVGDDNDVHAFMDSFPKDWIVIMAGEELEYERPTMIAIMSMEKITVQ